MTPSTKEIAKEIREIAKQIPGLRLSVRSDYNHIDVTIVSFPRPVLTDLNADYQQINHYNFNESEKLTADGKAIFWIINEVIQKYHWDKSDLMTDYHHCAFYYSYSVGKWDKKFELAA